MVQSTVAQRIRFVATPQTVERTTIVRLPEAASERLPSRGQVAVLGTINGHAFRAVLEPDGQKGHWMRVDNILQRAAGIKAGEVAQIEMESTKEWPEPDIPHDLDAALAVAPQQIQQMWEDITPMARWEWVRWINATKNRQTRDRRVEVAISKLQSGKRRPCCFDLASCTDPELSKNGRLAEAM